MSTHFDLLEQIARAPALGAKLSGILPGSDVVFEHVTEAAQPFLAALVTRQARQRTWIVCPNVRAQELFHGELLNWFPTRTFFRKQTWRRSRERLRIRRAARSGWRSSKSWRAKVDRQIVVLTEASLRDQVPSAKALQQQELRLVRSMRLDREELMARLAGAGYERVSQVSSRGQFAVRGGIIDVYSLATLLARASRIVR